MLRDLPVYLDADTDLIRLRTRLHWASSLTFDYSNPIIIPRGELAKKLAIWKFMSNDFMLAKEPGLIYCANVIGSAVGFGTSRMLSEQLAKPLGVGMSST